MTKEKAIMTAVRFERLTTGLPAGMGGEPGVK